MEGKQFVMDTFILSGEKAVISARYSNPLPSKRPILSPGLRRNTVFMCLASEPVIIDVTPEIFDGSIKKYRILSFIIQAGIL